MAAERTERRRLDVAPARLILVVFFFPALSLFCGVRPARSKRCFEGWEHGHINADFRNDTDCGKGFDTRHRQNKIDCGRYFSLR